MLTYATITNVGDRKVNEDSIGVFKNDSGSCFLVCDGLGGHGMGDVASGIVRDVFENLFSKTDDIVNFTGETLTAAQEVLMTEQTIRNEKRKMKTTAVSLTTDGKTVYIGHIGDSRLYAFSRGKVKFRTIDHSVPQMLALSHEIKEQEIRYHPDRNLLLRVMGTDWDEPMYELHEPVPLKKYQAFLLCSDGFWELVDEKTMCSLLKKSKSVEEWLYNMTEVVKQNGANKDMDNYSAIAVWNK